MTPQQRPIESDYTSLVGYTRALEEYCDTLAQPEPAIIGTYLKKDKEQEPEIVERVRRWTGKTMRTARNPNITARECIELANWIDANTAPPAQKETYQQSNPLGGPAKVFDAMADAIRAGDSYESVLKQFGYQLAQPEQEYDWKDLYEKEKRRSAMWIAKYEELAGPAPKAYPLTQPEQKPVGYWMGEFNDGAATLYEVPQESVFGRTYRNMPVYTTPPQRTWVGLKDEDRQAAFESLPDMLDGFLNKWGWLHFAKAIETKLKEKNT